MNRAEAIEEAISALPEQYTVLNSDGSVAAPRQVVAIGSGGSGVVIRTLLHRQIPRAIKLLIPATDLLRTPDARRVFSQNFEREIQTLAELNHPCIARIADYGVVSGSDNETKYPYFSMDYVSGVDLDAFVNDPTSTGTEIMEIILQMFNAVHYLHENRVMHSDLKPENIRVTITETSGIRHVRAVLLDLGVSHVFSRQEENVDRETYFFSTKKYVIPALLIALANKTHNKISIGDLATYFPAQDLYSLGIILNDILQPEPVLAKLRKTYGEQCLEALRRVAERLSSRTVYGSYSTTRAALNAILRAPSTVLAPGGIQVLSVTGPRGIVLPDAVGKVSTDGPVGAIVSHPLFQRLHNFNQLDLLHYVLPGGTQSRYQHALRQMDLARGAILRQMSEWRFRIDVEPKDIEGTITLALVDSVGRYQLHHMFADFYSVRGQIQEAGLLTNDELLDEMFGLEPSTSLGAQLREVVDARGRTVRDVANVDWEGVKTLRRTPSTPVQGFLSALLNSPVDVNKLAYLRQDSLSTGLPFGRVVEPAALFDFLRLPSHEQWAAQAGGQRSILGLREDGLPYAEAAILARYWSIKTGYWHRTNRALQAMVKFVIASLLKAKRLDFERYLMSTLHSSTREALRWLSQEFEDARLAGVLPENIVNPIAELNYSQRNAYQRLMTISPKSEISSRGIDHQIFEAANRYSALDEDRFCAVAATVLNNRFPTMKVRPGEILLDLPRASKEESDGRIFVYADEPGAEYIGELGGPRSVSPLLGPTLSMSFDLYVKRMRMFIHPRVYRFIGQDFSSVHSEVLDNYREQVRGGRI